MNFKEWKREVEMGLGKFVEPGGVIDLFKEKLSPKEAVKEIIEETEEIRWKLTQLPR